MKYTHFSEKGPRDKNEDYCKIVKISDERTLFVVCDGMGGYAQGEVASRTVCEAFATFWQEHADVADSEQKVQDAAAYAFKRLSEEAHGDYIGTTVVLCSIEGNRATVAHAGDSRCYIIDIKGNVKYFTLDHIDHRKYMHKAFFTYCPDDAVPEVKTVVLQPLDRILICTDGVYNAVSDNTLLHILQCSKDVEQVAGKYISYCKDYADDNHSAIIVEIE